MILCARCDLFQIGANIYAELLGFHDSLQLDLSLVSDWSPIPSVNFSLCFDKDNLVTAG
jgi:hypothetical protein